MPGDFPAIDLGDTTTPAGVVDAMGRIVGAVATGELTTEQAKALSDIIEVQRKAIELNDMELRLREIEAHAGINGTHPITGRHEEDAMSNIATRLAKAEASMPPPAGKVRVFRAIVDPHEPETLGGSEAMLAAARAEGFQGEALCIDRIIVTPDPRP